MFPKIRQKGHSGDNNGAADSKMTGIMQSSPIVPGCIIIAAVPFHAATRRLGVNLPSVVI